VSACAKRNKAANDTIETAKVRLRQSMSIRDLDRVERADDCSADQDTVDPAH
jgi:hypothetical protein